MHADLWVMLHPGAAYARLFARPDDGGAWVLWRRPLFVALVLGCMVSLITVRTLDARLVLSSMGGWAFVPLGQMLSLLTVWVGIRPRLSFPTAVDLFFTGHGPWSVWSIAFAAFWSEVPDPKHFFVVFSVWACSVCAVAVWSAYLDLCFFRRISPTPGRALFLQRAISWSLFLGVWGGGWVPAEAVARIAG
jgi:hypothetical protein